MTPWMARAELIDRREATVNAYVYNSHGRTLKILEVLADGCVWTTPQIARETDLETAAVRHHIGVLRKMGLIIEETKGERGPGGPGDWRGLNALTTRWQLRIEGMKP